MDLTDTLRGLYEDKEKLERVIAALEELQQSMAAGSRPRDRRGRKFMSADERQQVSARMKKYWAGRRRKTNA